MLSFAEDLSLKTINGVSKSPIYLTIWHQGSNIMILEETVMPLSHILQLQSGIFTK